MFKPGLKAGIIGGIIGVLIALGAVLAFNLPARTAAILSCLTTPISLLVALAIGLLAARFALSSTQEKLGTGKTAVAGVWAGLFSSLVGLVGLPITLGIQNSAAYQARMVDIQVEVSRMMGVPDSQIEMVRAQIIAAQKSGMTNNPGMLAVGVVIGLVISVGLGAAGGAIGGLVFKPKASRKLVCEKCQAKYDMGANAMIEAREGQPDLVDYANWEDLSQEARKQQRALVEQAFAVQPDGQARQWECGMCKTAQAYPQQTK